MVWFFCFYHFIYESFSFSLLILDVIISFAVLAVCRFTLPDVCTRLIISLVLFFISSFNGVQQDLMKYFLDIKTGKPSVMVRPDGDWGSIPELPSTLDFTWVENFSGKKDLAALFR